MTYQCSGCENIKPLNCFRKRNDPKSKLGIHSLCKECYKNKYRASSNVSSKKYVERNKEKHSAACKKWAKENKGKVNAKTAKRAAAKAQRTPKWLTKIDFDLIKLVYERAAIITKETGIKHEVDHILPLRGKNVSGLHVPQNLQIITKEQNLKKAYKFEVK